MGKYCTDCAKEIEKQDKQEEMFAIGENVRCKECKAKQEKSSGFGGFGDFSNPNPAKADKPAAGTG